MSQQVTVSISVEVLDEQRLRESVRQMLIEAGVGIEEADEVLDGARKCLKEVVRLAVDTNPKIAGTQILDSFATIDEVDAEPGPGL